jgi:hypothetical protein
MTTSILNYGAGAQPRSNLMGTDGWYNYFGGAGFYDIAGANITPVTFDPSAIASIAVFSFLSDPLGNWGNFQVYSEAATITDTGADTHAKLPFHIGGLDLLVNPAIVQALAMFTVVAGGGNIYNELRATTTTNGLTVAGRAMLIGIVNVGYVDAMAAALEVSVAPIISATGGSADSAPTAGTTTALTAIIPEADYSAAIRAAGNTFTDGAGNVWAIKGLYETVAPA